jgi:acyl carrier protein
MTDKPTAISSGSRNVNTIEVSSCSTGRDIKSQLRRIIKDHAGLKLPLEKIEDSTDLYRAGMSSQSSVTLMIAVEAEFELEFPDAMLSRDVFTNLETIASAIEAVRRAEQ